MPYCQLCGEIVSKSGECVKEECRKKASDRGSSQVSNPQDMGFRDANESMPRVDARELSNYSKIAPPPEGDVTSKPRTVVQLDQQRFACVECGKKGLTAEQVFTPPSSVAASANTRHTICEACALTKYSVGTCPGCSKPVMELGGKMLWVEVQGKKQAWHKGCHLPGVQCVSCNLPVPASQLLTLDVPPPKLSLNFHKACFVCASCKTSLLSGPPPNVHGVRLFCQACSGNVNAGVTEQQAFKNLNKLALGGFKLPKNASASNEKIGNAVGK